MGQSGEQTVRRKYEGVEQDGFRIDFVNIKPKEYAFLQKLDRETPPQKVQILASLLASYEHSAGWFVYKNVDYPTTMSLLKLATQGHKDIISERSRLASEYLSLFCNSILEEIMTYESTPDTSLKDIILDFIKNG